MPKPPPLPAEVIARVTRVAGLDGRVLVFIAGGFGLLSALNADWLGATVGAFAAAAGVIELNGRRRLKSGDTTGITWLVRSQLMLLAVILTYVLYQYFTYNPAPMLARLESTLAKMQQEYGMEPVSLASSAGMSPAEFQIYVKKSVQHAYLAVGAASILFQGGLAFYYHRKGRSIAPNLRKS